MVRFVGFSGFNRLAADTADHTVAGYGVPVTNLLGEREPIGLGAVAGARTPTNRTTSRPGA